MTPRENMLNILHCRDYEWTPIVFYADPYNHPDPQTLPEHLRALGEEKFPKWIDCCDTYIPISDYLGIKEYLFQAPAPVAMYLSPDAEEVHYTEGDFTIGKITTKSGELTERIRKGVKVKPYCETPEDFAIFNEYVDSWRYELCPDSIERIKRVKEAIGDNGVIILNGEGTPLGMMHRVYSKIDKIVYTLADEPEQVEELLAHMESNYLENIRMILENAPEIDVINGLDDTSSTIVSPSMFEHHNVELINKRVEIVEKYGRTYMHHSCGLLRHLLPVYKKARMHGIDAFTRPPIGDITWAEGRKILGDNYSIISSAFSGSNSLSKDQVINKVHEISEDAKAARFITLKLTSIDMHHSFELIQIALDVLRKDFGY